VNHLFFEIEAADLAFQSPEIFLNFSQALLNIFDIGLDIKNRLLTFAGLYCNAFSILLTWKYLSS
jgi:hypothetical protein